MLETLFYPDEVRQEHGVDLDRAKVSERELDMAFTLIELLRKPFEPEEYHDHYREALAKLIEAKLEGREVVKSPAARETKVIDLADALRRASRQRGRAAARRPRPRRRLAGRPGRAPGAEGELSVHRIGGTDSPQRHRGTEHAENNTVALSSVTSVPLW